MVNRVLNIWLCDARNGEPKLKSFELVIKPDESPTVGLALVKAGVVSGQEDPAISRKGCFGVFGKRKDWDSPIYDGDRLELYSELLIDPMEARRKKANKNLDNRLQAKAAGRKGRFLSKQS